MRFENWHPVNGFLFLILVIGGTIISTHPLLLSASFISASIYIVYHKGRKGLLRKFWVVAPIVICFTLLNPLFNHQGVTVIGYYKENPITAESVAYGFMASFMVSTVILWFTVFHEFMSSDKWTCLFGSWIPSVSLIISMALRMAPDMAARARLIRNAGKGLGVKEKADGGDRDGRKGIRKETFRLRIRRIKKEMYTLTSWSLEDAMDTAISMKSRGYGLKKRTTYTNYKMSGRDVKYLVLLLGFLVALLMGTVRDYMTISYFPGIRFPKWDVTVLFVYFSYLILLNIPILSDMLEELKWRYIRSGI